MTDSSIILSQHADVDGVEPKLETSIHLDF